MFKVLTTSEHSRLITFFCNLTLLREVTKNLKKNFNLCCDRKFIIINKCDELIHRKMIIFRIDIQIQIKMSENSLSVGSIVHMDGANCTKGIWISQAFQFEDIYLTESEDFWQEQELDCDKQLFEFIVSEESPASEGFLFNQSTCCEALSTSKQTSTVSLEEFLIDEAPNRCQSPCIALSFGEKLPSENTEELMQIPPFEVAHEGYEACEIEMIDVPASLTGMFMEQTLFSGVSDEGIYEIEMIDQSACLTDMQPVVPAYQKSNKIR